MKDVLRNVSKSFVYTMKVNGVQCFLCVDKSNICLGWHECSNEEMTEFPLFGWIISNYKLILNQRSRVLLTKGTAWASTAELSAEVSVSVPLSKAIHFSLLARHGDSRPLLCFFSVRSSWPLSFSFLSFLIGGAHVASLQNASFRTQHYLSRKAANRKALFLSAL